MKKFKALIFALALGFTVAATAVACDNNNAGETPGFNESVESLAKVIFDKTEVKVYQYEQVALICNAKGTNEKIVYTSSDETVASVDANGLVTARDKVGKVTITATAGGVSATCAVTVEKSPYHPQIVLNSTNYTIEENSTLSFNVVTEWNKSVLAEEIEYSLAFAENSQNAKATLSVEGDKITVTSSTAESFDVIIFTEVRGLYTSQQFTVNVVAPKLKLVSMAEGFQPDNGIYTTKLSSTSLVGDMANSIPMSFTLTKGSQKIENADIDWSINGTAVAIEGNNLIGKEVGEAIVVGTAEYEGETVSVQIQCNVIPPELTLDETIVLDLQEENLTFTLKSTFVGSLKNAEYDGVVVSSRARGQTIAFNASKFPTTASKLGKQMLIVNTNLVRYTMPVELYTKIIRTADDLDQMRLIANTGNEEYSARFGAMKNAQFFDGYFVLGNDIAYNKTITSMTDTGSVWGVQGYETDDRGFKGVFDGQGYNIDGVTVGNHPSGDKKQAGGIFGYIATGGIVRNVSFTNAVLLANNGFICVRGNGTVENVSVSYKKLGGDKATQGLSGSSNRTMGTFFSYAAGPQATVKNCLVDASAAEIFLEFGSYNGAQTMNVNLVGKAQNVESVVALCPDTRVLEASGADVKRLTYNDLIAESEIFKNFDKTIWTTVDGIPMFINQAETLNRDFSVDFLGVKSSLVAGFSMLVLANNPYTRIELTPVEGVAFENSMLSATEEAFTKTVTLKVVSLLNPENTKTIEVYIDSFGTAVAAPTEETTFVYYNNPVLTIGDNSWMGEENYAYIGGDIYSVGNGAGSIVLDWKALGWNKQAVTIVTVKEGVRTHFEADLQITYPVSNFEDGVKVADSVLDSRRTLDGHLLVDVASDLEAPEGYENVIRVDSASDWSSALPRPFFSLVDLSAYKDVWFGIKIVNGGWVMRANAVPITGWVFFHYIQVEDGVWVAEITAEGSLYLTEFDVKGVNLQALTYRDGWSNGLLLYNNGGRRPEGEVTKLYVTEIRGVLK